MKLMDVLEENTSSDASGNSFTILLYIVEYLLGILIAFIAVAFLLFHFADSLDAQGVNFLIFVAFIGLFNIIAGIVVHQNVRKLRQKGVNTGNSPFGWAIIVFLFPVLGLAIYLALRRASYKKQLATMPTNKV